MDQQVIGLFIYLYAMSPINNNNRNTYVGMRQIVSVEDIQTLISSPQQKKANRDASLKKIRDRHREMMRRLIIVETQVQIAKDMGLSSVRVNIICNSPLFKREKARLEAEVR